MCFIDNTIKTRWINTNDLIQNMEYKQLICSFMVLNEQDIKCVGCSFTVFCQ